MHDDAYISGCSENNINASCMTISGRRIKQLDIFCRVSGVMSDFLSFIVVELIRFFHGAIQLSNILTDSEYKHILACAITNKLNNHSVS